MFQDEIVEEIHRIREEYAKSFNYNLDAICADLQKQQVESGWEIVKLPPKGSLTPKRWSRRARNLDGEAKDISLRSS